jgi:hypothetical protein
MKLSIRLTTLAITAVACAGVLGAQQRSGAHASGRPQGHAQSRAQAPRADMASRARQDGRAQHYASARVENRARNDVQARGDFRGRADIQARNDFRGRSDFQVRNDVRGRVDGRMVPVASHGRPLITRAPVRAFDGAGVYGASRFVGGRGFVPRFAGLPFGWEGRLVFHGFFPVSYASYCAPVPVDYNYMLPPMAPSYDPCLFGDRVVVFDRFSRSIVFVAAI